MAVQLHLCVGVLTPPYGVFEPRFGGGLSQVSIFQPNNMPDLSTSNILGILFSMIFVAWSTKSAVNFLDSVSSLSKRKYKFLIFR